MLLTEVSNFDKRFFLIKTDLSDYNQVFVALKEYLCFKFNRN